MSKQVTGNNMSKSIQSKGLVRKWVGRENEMDDYELIIVEARCRYTGIITL